MSKLEYLSPERIELIYGLPLAEVVRDFFDQLKSHPGLRQPGLQPAGYDRSDLVRVDVLLNGVAAGAFRRHRPQGQGLRLRPPHGGGCESAPAVRRAHPGRHRRADHLPGDRQGEAQRCACQVLWGDITRKRKLLERQKEGKKADEVDRAGQYRKRHSSAR